MLTPRSTGSRTRSDSSGAWVFEEGDKVVHAEVTFGSGMLTLGDVPDGYVWSFGTYRPE